MPKVRAIVLDFDGTLIDTMGGFADVAARVMHAHQGLDLVLARRRYIETSGVPFREQLEDIVPGDPRNNAAAAEFERDKQDGFFAERFSEEVRAAVRSLRARGFLVVVSSNNHQDLVDRFVAREGVEFDLVLGASEGFYKGRDHFGRIAEVSGVTLGEMVFVGDSLRDGERAMECGVRFVAKAGTFTRAEFEARFPGVTVVEGVSEVAEMSW